MTARLLLRPGRTITPAQPGAPAGPFDFPTQLVGATADSMVTVFYDPALGPPGLKNATDLLAAAQAIYAENVAWFGIRGQPINVIIAALDGSTEGSSGAYHMGCDFAVGGNLYLDADFADSAVVIGLFEAELSECFMGAAGRGFNCGGSGGEALSRFLAEAVSGGANGALAPYTTAPDWDRAGRPNWIDTDQGSDQDPVSTGCGLGYLSWVKSLGHTTAQICQAGGATLAENYQALTGKATAWVDFSAALLGLVTIANDDPFAGAGHVPQSDPAPAAPSAGATQAQVNAAIDAFADNLKALVASSGLPA